MLLVRGLASTHRNDIAKKYYCYGWRCLLANCTTNKSQLLIGLKDFPQTLDHTL